MSPRRLARLALSFGWELPQNALGAAALALQLARGRVRSLGVSRERLMIELEGGAAVSLGFFVFHTSSDNEFVPVGPENEAHEFGHSVQSRRLGPLYLPLIGLPSVLRVAYAVTYKIRYGTRWAHYYDGYPEDEADALGGVDRTLRPRP